MTHTTKIPVSNELENEFSRARTQGGVRFIKVVIKDEQLFPAESYRLSSDLRADFAHVESHFEPKIPCYVVFRLDTQNLQGYEWLLIAWVPDGSVVKERMLYASTRDPLKKQLGKGYFFASDLFGTELADFSWDSLETLLTKPTFTAPLTASEMQYHHETTLEVDHGHTREYVHGVKFPLSRQAQEALESFSMRQNFVQLRVDASAETVELVNAKKISTNQLPGEFSSSEPRFAFYKYTHNFAGESMDSNLFIYCCPENAPVKLKMLYSTVKAVVTVAAEHAKVLMEKNGKIETDNPAELTPEFLNDTLHPKAQEKKGFARPMRPGKGGARLVKNS